MSKVNKPTAQDLKTRADIAERQWLSEMVLSLEDARMLNPGLFPPAELRGDHENEDIEAEACKVPKKLSEQVAKTIKGRACQAFAEEVQTETDKRNEAAIDGIDFGTRRDFIEILLADGQLTNNRFREIDVNEDLTTEQLQSIREALLDIRMDSFCEDRAQIISEVSHVVNKIDNRVDETEAPKRLVTGLKQLKALQDLVHQAVKERQFFKLPFINAKLVEIAQNVLEQLNFLRGSDPDKLIQMTQELQQSDNTVTNPYKTVLIEYVKTHNSFRFSEDIECGLRYEVQEAVKYGKRRGQQKASFPEVLSSAYHQEKQADDPETFIAKITRIPQHKLKAILEQAN
ncbi:hypothetical protein JXD20_04225 [Candidatus Peregrinibacteria bacterium]|nr:hypothetical protein [Candidatus Peregrinibacteria bacterium]